MSGDAFVHIRMTCCCYNIYLRSFITPVGWRSGSMSVVCRVFLSSEIRGTLLLYRLCFTSSLTAVKLSEMVTLLTCILEVPGLNLGQDTDCPDRILWVSCVRREEKRLVVRRNCASLQFTVHSCPIISYVTIECDAVCE